MYVNSVCVNTLHYLQGIISLLPNSKVKGGSKGTCKISLEFLTCKQDITESYLRRHPDQDLNTSEVLSRYGYPHSSYQVETEDHYRLIVYRIKGSPKYKQKYVKNKLPVYINHGLVGASDWWFFQPRNKNLPLKLADKGHEVWLSNARGSTYSTGHKTLNYTTDLEYWNFGLHELGIYDVPAVTSVILRETKQDKILYVGYSMGTTQLLISLSELPSMNNKIAAGFLLAPVSYMGHINSPLREIAPHFESENAFNAVNAAAQGRFRSTAELVSVLKVSMADICSVSAAQCGVCDNLWMLICGYNPAQIDKYVLPLIFSRAMNSASVKIFSHYAQLVKSCRFQKYSYSPSKNMELYGSLVPPEYELANINVPLHFYTSERDAFGVPEDIQITADHFKPGVLKSIYKVEDPAFTHVDFLIAKDGDKLLYNQIVSDIGLYNSSNKFTVRHK